MELWNTRLTGDIPVKDTVGINPISVSAQSFEEEDFWGNVTIRTEEVGIKMKEVRITLFTSEDSIYTGIYTEESPS